MPIHRLDQPPTRHAVLGDITCDSDGRIDQFLGRRDVKRTLPLHTFDGRPYYLGAFLVGAYQEILGDLHNLFGDTNAVHVSRTEDGQVELETIVKGDTVSEVLDYVQFQGRDLIHRLQSAVDVAVREGRIDHKQAGQFVKFYDSCLGGYTYLEEANPAEDGARGD
jgi:arginine decarboxylase